MFDLTLLKSFESFLYLSVECLIFAFDTAHQRNTASNLRHAIAYFKHIVGSQGTKEALLCNSVPGSGRLGAQYLRTAEEPQSEPRFMYAGAFVLRIGDVRINTKTSRNSTASLEINIKFSML